MDNTLLIRLEGPLQAWGERARWSVRDSAPQPTKSGVVGLLGCALGYRSDDELRRLSRSIRLGVRCDRPGSPLVDYHTVVGGVMSADGRVKKTASTGEFETVVSWRYYLCDASFLVAVQSTPDVVASLSAAIRRPHWVVYLGRKSCPPSRPLFAGVGDFASIEAALAAQPVCVPDGAAGDTTRVRAVLECTPAEGVRRREEILSRSHRTFAPRYTREVALTVPVHVEEV